MNYDIIVIGAGIGGLTAAALLAHAGYRVLALESHIEPGGCASSYERRRPNGDRYVFDVGATLFAGFTPWAQISWQAAVWLVPIGVLTRIPPNHVCS